MATTPKVLALQAEQISQQLAEIKAQLRDLYLAGAIPSVQWAACDAYLYSMQTPIAVVVGNLHAVTRQPSPELAAVAADPRA